jgi:hypothetical protein
MRPRHDPIKLWPAFVLVAHAFRVIGFNLLVREIFRRADRTVCDFANKTDTP